MTALLAQGCDGVECGPGTVERGGDCVAEESPVGDCKCGVGAHLDTALGVCVPDHPPAVCNPETTVEVVGNDGVILCKGDCGAGCPPACPLPSQGRVTICGQLVDIETSERITAEDGGTGALCDDIPVEDRSGPCLLEVSISDGLEWPLAAQTEISVYDCGYYAVSNLPAPEAGRVMITVDDAEGSGDAWAPTAVTFRIAAGEQRDAVHTYALRRSTDSAWTASAGEPFSGLTFSQRGALALIFLRSRTPVTDVQIQRNPGGVDADTDYYFSDLERGQRTTIDPDQDATGFNGTGLMVDSPLVDHAGLGGLPDLCSWPWEIAGTFPGLLLVSERHAEHPGGTECE